MTDHDESPPSKLGCTDPQLGAVLSRMLGIALPLPLPLAAHIRDCPACQLELHAFRSLDDAAAELPAGFVSTLRRALEGVRG
jgi:hypothetical protein